MNKEPRLSNLTVKEPCHQDWAGMSGDDRCRFCEHCTQQVHDLSAMTEREAARLIARHPEGLCVRLKQDARGNVLYRKGTEWLAAFGRWRAQLASIGLVTAGLVLPGCSARDGSTPSAEVSGTGPKASDPAEPGSTKTADTGEATPSEEEVTDPAVTGTTTSTPPPHTHIMGLIVMPEPKPSMNPKPTR